MELVLAMGFSKSAEVGFLLVVLKYANIDACRTSVRLRQHNAIKLSDLYCELSQSYTEKTRTLRVSIMSCTCLTYVN